MIDNAKMNSYQEFIIEDNHIYRLKKNKKKLLCPAYPELVNIDGFDRESNSISHYTFIIHSNRIDTHIKIEVPGDKLSGKTYLFKEIIKKVPFTFWEGNAEDFRQYITFEINNYFDKKKSNTQS